MDGKTTTFEVDGKKRVMSYDLNALAEIGDRIGIKIKLDKLSESLMEPEYSPSALRTIWWAGFIHEDEELTEKEAGKWVNQDNIAEALDCFMRLFGGIVEGVMGEDTQEPPVEETKKPPPRRRAKGKKPSA